MTPEKEKKGGEERVSRKNKNELRMGDAHTTGWSKTVPEPFGR